MKNKISNKIIKLCHQSNIAFQRSIEKTIKNKYWYFNDGSKVLVDSL